MQYLYFFIRSVINVKRQYKPTHLSYFSMTQTSCLELSACLFRLDYFSKCLGMKAMCVETQFFGGINLFMYFVCPTFLRSCKSLMNLTRTEAEIPDNRLDSSSIKLAQRSHFNWNFLEAQ